MIFIPASKPKATAMMVRDVIASQLAGDCPDMEHVNMDALRRLMQTGAFIVADRGYYLSTMGNPQRNDFGLYDDAAFLVTPDSVTSYNWNVDPSAAGWNAALGKPYANLMAGLWPFIKGLHKGKEQAFRQPYQEQAQKLKLGNLYTDGRRHGWFKVLRSDPARNIRMVDEGYHAINGHSGNDYGTSSWGCQTGPKSQFTALRKATYTAMEKANQTVLPYLLTECAFQR